MLTNEDSDTLLALKYVIKNANIEINSECCNCEFDEITTMTMPESIK